jgi:hypothetical protein
METQPANTTCLRIAGRTDREGSLRSRMSVTVTVISHSEVVSEAQSLSGLSTWIDHHPTLIAKQALEMMTQVT